MGSGGGFYGFPVGFRGEFGSFWGWVTSVGVSGNPKKSLFCPPRKGRRSWGRWTPSWWPWGWTKRSSTPNPPPCRWAAPKNAPIAPKTGGPPLHSPFSAPNLPVFTPNLALFDPKFPGLGPKLSLFRPELFLFGPKLSLFDPKFFLFGLKLSLFGPKLSLFDPNPSFLATKCPFFRPKLSLFRPKLSLF